MLKYYQAIVIGLIQGVTELFPISSLGHSVLIPALLGWDSLVSAQSKGESFYLAFLVALHVATMIKIDTRNDPAATSSSTVCDVANPSGKTPRLISGLTTIHPGPVCPR